MILQPLNSFTVVRQIPDHTDLSTNYVRAVIRNAYTDAIIATLNLTDQGSQRFSKNWQVPADSSGQGFYISIVTSVYTDSGYTTKNTNYGDDENTYLIQDRLLNQRGGGRASLDAYTVRRIVQEELDKLPKPDPVEIPPQKEYEMRWDEILAAIKAIDTKTESIPTEKTDLQPVIDAIERAQQAIEEKEVTPPTDLSPVLSHLDQGKTDDELNIEELKSFLEGMESKLGDTIQTSIADAIATTKFVSTFSTEAKSSPKKGDTAEEPMLDPRNLAL